MPNLAFITDVAIGLFLLENDRSLELGDDSSSSDSESDTSMTSDDQVPSPTKLAAFELQVRLQSISEIVDKLLKLAELIRASGSRSRASRATNYEHIEDGVNQTALFEKEYLPQVLKYRFKLEEPLLSSFCAAISLRRRRFLYQSKHQKRLAYGGGAQEEPTKKPENKQVLPTAKHRATGSTPSQLAMPGKSGGKIDTSTEAPTKATTFKIQQKPRAPSIIVSASTKSAAAGMDFPHPPPMASERATHFQCPYCCVLVPKTKREPTAWRHHVIMDLQPFVCIEPDCSTPDALFESRTEWIEHQKWEHAMEWWCEGDDGKHAALKFDTEAAFSRHLVKSHQLKLTKEKLRTHLTMAGHPSLTPFSCCPFCDFMPENIASLHLDQSEDGVFRAAASQKALQDHLTQELFGLFLLALPDRYDEENSGTDSETQMSLGTRSTILGDIADSAIVPSEITPLNTRIHDGRLENPLFHEHEMFDDQEDWTFVWASPQLKQSIRESYEGLVHDDVLKHLAIKQDQYEPTISSNWRPGIYVGKRKLLSPKLLPLDVGQSEGVHATDDFFPILKIDTASGEIEYERYSEWESQRENFTKYYHIENRTLTDSARCMRENHSFNATPREWQRKAIAWGLEKFGIVAEDVPIHPEDWEWENQRENFIQYYKIDNRTVKDAAKCMSDNHEFHATPQEWQRKVKAWGLQKYTSREERLNQLEGRSIHEVATAGRRPKSDDSNMLLPEQHVDDRNMRRFARR